MLQTIRIRVWYDIELTTLCYITTFKAIFACVIFTSLHKVHGPRSMNSAFNASLLLLSIFRNGQSRRKSWAWRLVSGNLFHLKFKFVIVWTWQGVAASEASIQVCGCSPSSIYLVAPALPWSDTGQTLCVVSLIRGLIVAKIYRGSTWGYHGLPPDPPQQLEPLK